MPQLSRNEEAEASHNRVTNNFDNSKHETVGGNEEAEA